jgi:hypothetical protein
MGDFGQYDIALLACYEEADISLSVSYLEETACPDAKLWACRLSDKITAKRGCNNG